MPGAEAVYEAAQLWIDVGLRADESLFADGQSVWAAENAGDLYSGVLVS